MNAKEMFSKLGYYVKEQKTGFVQNFEPYISYENEDEGLRIIFERWKGIDVAFYKIHSETPTPITIIHDSIIEAVFQQIKEIKEMKGVK
jgi:hypothetical protein